MLGVATTREPRGRALPLVAGFNRSLKPMHKTLLFMSFLLVATGYSQERPFQQPVPQLVSPLRLHGGGSANYFHVGVAPVPVSRAVELSAGVTVAGGRPAGASLGVSWTPQKTPQKK